MSHPNPAHVSTDPSINLIVGPMFSGKSTELMRILTIYRKMKGVNVLYINAKCDNRSKKSFSTHNCIIGEIDFQGCKVEKLSEIEDIEKYDIIGVDEGQFFPDLYDTVMDWVEKKNKTVFISALNGDSFRQNFGQIDRMYPVCDNITKLSTFCSMCNEKGVITSAHFTKRITEEDGTVLVGGSDKYIAACRKCFKL